jgi:hypothetical protein
MASTTYLQHALKWAVFVNEARFDGETVTKRHQFAVLGNMVRNAGQLPQPFWLGAACGGGSCSLSASVARA